MSSAIQLNEFDNILDELRDMHNKKSKDYGTNTDPYANVCASSAFGIEPWVGALIREHDKTVRIQSFIAKGSLANESLEDSLIDKAVYSIIALLLYRRTQHSNTITEHTDHEFEHGVCISCGLIYEALQHAARVIDKPCKRQALSQNQQVSDTEKVLTEAFRRIAGQYNALGYFNEDQYNLVVQNLTQKEKGELHTRLLLEDFPFVPTGSQKLVPFSGWLNYPE